MIKLASYNESDVLVFVRKQYQNKCTITRVTPPTHLKPNIIIFECVFRFFYYFLETVYRGIWLASVPTEVNSKIASE